MGKCSRGIEWILLPPDEPSKGGQMGSSSRRRRAILFYRLILTGIVIGLFVLGMSWYKLTRSPTKQKVHDQIQKQLTSNTNKQWMKSYKETKDEEWDWKDDDIFERDGDYNNDYDYSGSEGKTQNEGKVGIPGVKGGIDGEPGDFDDNHNYYSADYGDHAPDEEEAWSMADTAEMDIANLEEVIPERAFRLNYKNPCWTEPVDIESPYVDNFYLKERPELKDYFDALYEKIGTRHWRMRCLPYFYVFDGPEAEYEEKDNFYKVFQFHPYIAKPPVHRAQYWNRKRLENGTKFRDYVDLFDQAASEIRADVVKLENADLQLAHAKIVGDDSGSYLWNFDEWRKVPLNDLEEEPTYIAADFIATNTPDVKFIIIVRNPLKRLAEYYYKVLNPGASEQDFQRDVMQSTTLFNQCVRYEEQMPRRCVYNKELNKRMKVPLRIALYSLFIPDWLLRFDRNQFKFIVYEEFRRLPINTLNSVYKYLGLGLLPPEQFADVKKHWYTAQENRTLIWPMLNETRKLLKEFFSPYNEALSFMIEKPNLVKTWDTAIDPDELQSQKKLYKRVQIKKKTKGPRTTLKGIMARTQAVQLTTRVPSYPDKESYNQVQHAVANNMAPQPSIANPSQQLGKAPPSTGRQWPVPRATVDKTQNVNANKYPTPPQADGVKYPNPRIDSQGAASRLQVPGAPASYGKPSINNYQPAPRNNVNWNQPKQQLTNQQDQRMSVKRFDQGRDGGPSPIKRQKSTVNQYPPEKAAAVPPLNKGY